MPISMEDRQRGYKNKGKDMDECRRRRTDVSVDIRKAKKDDQLTKKRQISSDMSLVSPLKENNQQTPSPAPLLSMEEIVATLLGNDQKLSDEVIFKAVQSTRRLLSREKNPPIDKVIKAGLVPSLMSLLQYNSNTDIQFEAAWAVTNIASGTSEQTKTVVEAGCINHFKMLLMSPKLTVCEQAVWALGNIAGDGPEYRDLVIDCGCVPPLINLIRNDRAVPFLRNITWTLSNICRNKNPPPDLNKIAEVLPVLATLIRHEDEEIVADTCWAFSYLTDGPNEKIARVISTEGVVPQLVNLLGHSNVSIITPSLRTIGNIVTGDDTQTQHVIESGALKPLRNLLYHSKSQLVKEAVWAISNVSAGTVDQIQLLINEDIIPLIIKVLDVGEFKVQKEAVWVITNLTSGGNFQQILYLMGCNVIEPLCNMLNVPDAKTVLVVLDGLKNILTKASQINEPLMIDGEAMNVLDQITLKIEEHGGVDSLEALQEHENDTVSKVAYDLIDQFFQGEDEEVDDNIAPQTDGGTYCFNADQPRDNHFAL